MSQIKQSSERPNSSDISSKTAIALVGGTLIDGNGGPPVKDSSVIISKGRIVDAGQVAEIQVPEMALVIDARGKYVMPGLIDVHVHYFDWMGELFLAHGVTTVKDLGNDLIWISTISSEIERGEVRAPRIFYVGNGLDAPPPARDTHVGVSNSEMCRLAVTLSQQKGATAVKVREKITPELLGAIADQAHKLGMPVTGHLRMTDAREAAQAGIDGLEHASGIVQALTRHPREIKPGEDELTTFIADLKAWDLVDLDQGKHLMDFLAAKRVAIIPTLANWGRMASARRDRFAEEDAGYAARSGLKYVPDMWRRIWEDSAVFRLSDNRVLAEVQKGYEKLQCLLVHYYEAGGRLLAASDTFISVPGASMQRELEMLVDAGFSELQAITMSTRDNSHFLGRSADLGTISRGKLADILVVDGNPLEDIRNTQQIHLVIKDGDIVDTNYHADYSVPTPRPAPTRPVWLESRLQS